MLNAKTASWLRRVKVFFGAIILLGMITKPGSVLAEYNKLPESFSDCSGMVLNESIPACQQRNSGKKYSAEEKDLCHCAYFYARICSCFSYSPNRQNSTRKKYGCGASKLNAFKERFHIKFKEDSPIRKNERNRVKNTLQYKYIYLLFLSKNIGWSGHQLDDFVKHNSDGESIPSEEASPTLTGISNFDEVSEDIVAQASSEVVPWYNPFWGSKRKGIEEFVSQSLRQEAVVKDLMKRILRSRNEKEAKDIVAEALLSLAENAQNCIKK